MSHDFKTLLRTYLREILRELIEEEGIALASEAPPPTATRYLYGLDGIASHFNVSRRTALKWKNGFLAPAITQRGRNIRTDLAKAEALYNENRPQA